MDKELQNLIESSEFQQYHEAHRNPTFNLFDVLRNAEFEIRHSNILEWLLDPGETHRAGSRFLREFIQCLNDNAGAAGIKRFPVPASFEKNNVRVVRELHRVDIAIFFKESRRWIIIENKTGERSSQHYKQVKIYERDYRKRYKGQCDDVHSVLLTTSSEGDDSEREVIHLSWSDVQESIERVRDKVDSENDEIRSFLSQYLDIIKRLTTSFRFERNYFTKLVGAHRPVLKGLLKERTQEQEEQSLLKDISRDYRATIERLVSDFGREPKRLGRSIQAFLRATREIKAKLLPDKYGTDFWLSWRMDDVATALGIDWRIRWEIALSHRRVCANLYFELNSKTRPVIERIEKFMREEHVATDKLVWEWQENYVYVYRHPLVDEEVLSGPFEEVERTTRERVNAFLEAEYKTVQGYFKCLIFGLRGSATDVQSP